MHPGGIGWGGIDVQSCKFNRCDAGIARKKNTVTLCGHFVNRIAVQVIAIAVTVLISINNIGLAVSPRKFGVVIASKDDRANVNPSSQYAESDAVQISNVLRQCGFLVHEFTDRAQHEGDRTAETIRHQVHEFCTSAEFLPEDLILFAFFGQILHIDGDKVGEMKRGLYLCPIDAIKKEVSGESDVMDSNNLIGLHEICDWIRGSKSRNKVLILDACRYNPD
jgi:hypothetical protein